VASKEASKEARDLAREKKGDDRFPRDRPDFREDGKGGKGAKGKNSKGGKRRDDDSNPFLSSDQKTEPTGPLLGRGSELKKVYAIHPGSRYSHWNSVEAMSLFSQSSFVSASSDSHFIIWEAKEGGPNGIMIENKDTIECKSGGGCSSLHLFKIDENNSMLFCGMQNGQIKCYHSNGKQMCLSGHERTVTCLTVHLTPVGQPVLISASEDANIRLWVYNDSAGCFNNTHTLNGQCGAVLSIQVLGVLLWIGGDDGISILNLEKLEFHKEKINRDQGAFCGPFLHYKQHIIAAFRDGSVIVYDSDGGHVFRKEQQGSHKSNIASALVFHEGIKDHLMLCGYRDGWVTAYDLPNFEARGSFVGVEGSDVTCILDLGVDGMFAVGGKQGDITLWQWCK